MNGRPKLSACIITLNEEDHLPRCLASIQELADEIVVVDSGSSDRTLQIARQAGARVWEQPFLGYVRQKQDALEKSTGEWVLCLDADEWLDGRLRREIAHELGRTQNETIVGYELNRRNYYLGQWIDHGNWSPQWRLRLIRRGCARWTGLDPHDQLQTDGPTRRLSGRLCHIPYSDISHHLMTINRYTDQMARNCGRTRLTTLLALCLEPPLVFVRGYLLRGGFRDGLRGFVVAGLHAFYVFVRHAKALEGTITSGPSSCRLLVAADPLLMPACFDPGLAEFATERVSLARVHDLLEASHAPRRVDEYCQAMRAGTRFPPISVIELFGHFLVVDGHKRLTAYRSLHAGEIIVELWTWRRWMRGLAEQTSRCMAKKVRLLRQAFKDPSQSRLLWQSTVRHWKRIALSLGGKAGHARAPAPDFTIVQTLRSGGPARATLRLVCCSSQLALLKDFSRSPLWFRRTCGWWMARRETAAYRRAGGIDGIPRLLARSWPDGLLLEFVAGINCLESDRCWSPAFFDDLRRVLRLLRRRGVLHGDVRRNVVVTDRGEPLLVDFGASFVMRWWLRPIRGILLRAAEHHDERAVVELKKTLAPALLTGEEAKLLATDLPWSRCVRLGQRLVRNGTGWLIRKACRDRANV